MSKAVEEEQGRRRDTHGRERNLTDERVGDVHECAHTRDERRALDGPEGDDRVGTWLPAVRVVLNSCENDRK